MDRKRESFPFFSLPLFFFGCNDNADRWLYPVVIGILKHVRTSRGLSTGTIKLFFFLMSEERVSTVLKTPIKQKI